MIFPPETVFTRSPDPLTTEIDGDVVMMDLASSAYFNLDSIGAAIWARLETPTRFEDLCGELHARYDAPLDIIRRDVAALLADMLTHGLVRKETA
ncbi:PqqD family protein (plasmid) [Tistrella mobilis]|uniref:PqqD family protein n=1 Tax=Tistrella mobilis TaxID=171437 RepID=UPI0035577513